MADSGPSDRRMRYPYTTTAQLRQFPYKYYFEKSWLFRYSFYAMFVAMPIFWTLQRLSNSEENKKMWDERRRKEYAGHH